MLRLLKALPLALALAVFSLFTAGCGSNSAQGRFVNAIQDTQVYGCCLDIDFNGNKVFSDIAFPNASASTYTSVPSGNPTIAGYIAGSTPPQGQIFSQSPPLGMNGGSQYTIVATGFDTGNGSNINIFAAADNNTEPANGSVEFRVINASPSGLTGGGGAVDVYFIPNPNAVLPSSCAAPNCISNVAYKSTSAYVTLPYNSEGNGWEMFVTPTGQQTVYINDTIGGFGNSSEGAICTLVLVDQANGSQMYSTPTVLQDLNASGCTAN